VTSKLESAMHFNLRVLGVPFVSEHRFCKRMWRFDFAIPELMIAIECEGGIFTNGRHTRGRAYESDMEKYNAAALLGWRVLRFSGDMIKNGYAARTIGRTVSEVRTVQSKFWNVPVSEYLLSSALLDIPTFEKSPRRAIAKMAIEKRRKTTQRKPRGAAK